MYLSQIAEALAYRINRAKSKNPAEWPGIERNIRRLDAAALLIDDAVADSGDGQTNGEVGT